MNDFTRKALELADAMVVAARREALLRQNKLLPEAKDALAAHLEDGEADGGRYRWLRDVSVPPHNFYLSVPIEFDGIKYSREEVDSAIDAARATDAGKG